MTDHCCADPISSAPEGASVSVPKRVFGVCRALLGSRDESVAVSLEGATEREAVKVLVKLDA